MSLLLSVPMTNCKLSICDRSLFLVFSLNILILISDGYFWKKYSYEYKHLSLQYFKFED